MVSRTLRYRVEIQDSTYVADSRGGQSETWETTSKRWADIRALAGKELYFAQLEHRKITHRVRLRIGKFDAQKQRIKWGDRYLKAVFVRDPMPRNTRYLEIMCSE